MLHSIRECLQFSALLRQDGDKTREEKLMWVNLYYV